MSEETDGSSPPLNNHFLFPKHLWRSSFPKHTCVDRQILYRMIGGMYIYCIFFPPLQMVSGLTAANQDEGAKPKKLKTSTRTRGRKWAGPILEYFEGDKRPHIQQKPFSFPNAPMKVILCSLSLEWWAYCISCLPSLEWSISFVLTRSQSRRRAPCSCNSAKMTQDAEAQTGDLANNWIASYVLFTFSSPPCCRQPSARYGGKV